MTNPFSLQTRVLGKIFLAITLETAICIGMIRFFKPNALFAIFDLAVLKNLDTYIGTIISIIFFTSVIYLLVQYTNIAPKGKKTAVIVLLFLAIGYIGYSLCFASVYFLHGGIVCKDVYDGTEFHIVFWYSFFLSLINPPDDFCTPNEFNKFIPIFQMLTIIVTGAFTAIIERFGVKESKY
jgi:hypothetical protein